jgi:hypothetical protein
VLYYCVTSRPSYHLLNWHESLGLGPQDSLQLLRLNRITGLKSLRGLRDVKFVKDWMSDSEDPAELGSILGEFMETDQKRDHAATLSARASVS